MIPLSPLPISSHHVCPCCRTPLDVTGWRIPGMRMLADLTCRRCRREFHGDLPAGHGLYYPALLEKKTGTTYQNGQEDWFAQLLATSYAERTSAPVNFQTESFRPIQRPLLLNCLDIYYGHALLKLLNAQFYLDHHPEMDLILLVPGYLRWLVPNGVAAIWQVDLPLKRGAEWNDWLAAEIQERAGAWPELWLSVAFSHPHPEEFTISRFSRVSPFPVEDWQDEETAPTVTFIWREDRLWDPQSSPLRVRRGVKRLLRRLRLSRSRQREQQRQVIALAERLRRSIRGIRFAVAGLGAPGGFPEWVQDLRTVSPEADTEKDWCEQYAQSHVVVGIHGSNMLLPSAHAGAVVEIVPEDRWGNLAQDILINTEDVREGLFRYRFLPEDIRPERAALIIADLIQQMPVVRRNYCRPWNDHRRIQQDPFLIMNAGNRHAHSDC